MTAVNLISCIIFTKGSPLKAKIQLYAMALFFLVFLYRSPAGLVFYWTLNNVFSLVKTCFYKLKNPGKILSILFSGCGILAAVYGVLILHQPTVRKVIFVIGISISMQLPLIGSLLKSRVRKKKIPARENKKIFFGGAVFLAILTGALIPSAVIKTSPLEFMDITYFYHPLWFIVNSFCLALGIFVLWTGVFYYLATSAVRMYFDRGVCILSGVFIVDYLFFGKDMGLLTERLVYENNLQFTNAEQLQNALAAAVVILIFCMIFRYRLKLVLEMLMIGILALSCMTTVNIAGINKSVNSIMEKDLEMYEAVPQFTLSKTGKNVIVLMLDQAIGKYVPYLFAEKPELKEQFDGFTYYANTVSFGAHTNFGTPALFGGYEYTPVEINKRSEESLESKQNEALKVMPVLFDQNDYRVTVCDPPYAGYQWIPDLSIYDDYPEIQRYILSKKFTDASIKGKWIQENKRNFFCYGIMKAAPLCFQKTIYDYGRYNKEEDVEAAFYTLQAADSIYTAHGMTAAFMNCYNELSAYSDITNVVDDDANTFLMLVNGLTHDVMMLQEPEYMPAVEVDNTEYERDHQNRYVVNGQPLLMTTAMHMVFYQTNMSALLMLGEWFDYMRENGVYDNTRIILVADHGRSVLHDGDEYRLGDRDIECFYPLLMAKDFDGKEFRTSEEFMTNADVPVIAMKDIIDDPVNPFTGKIIDTSEKTKHEQYIIVSDMWSIEENNGNTYLPSKWYAVQDDMRNPDNWKLLSEEETLFPPVGNGD